MPNTFAMPGFKALNLTGKPVATLFQIRLESDTIVLRGPEAEASSQILRGSVVLCLPHTLKVENVHLKLIGISRVSWTDQRVTATGVSNIRRLKTQEVLNHRWPNFVGHDGPASSSKGVTLGKTNHEWPFEFIVPGDTPETVDGLPESSIRYVLRATVARGKFSVDLHASKHLRIVRTLDPAALELSHNMTVENIWANKIEYSIVVPQKAVVFGTGIPVEMRLTPLLKGLRIGTVRCKLVESVHLSIPGENGISDKTSSESREIDTWTYEVNQDHLLQDVIENVEDAAQDYFGLKEILPLPKSLKSCLQDCETQGIKIRHRLKFNISLHNPDGHISELRATLPVTLFLSPNVPLDENGNLLDQTPDMNFSADVAAHAPPVYGEHVLDQLFADSETSGYATPAHASSGMNTPFYAHSRAGSIENLRNLNGMPHTGVRPDALSNRLQNLTSPPRSSSDPAIRNATFSGGNTPAIPIRGGLGHRANGSISTPGSLSGPNGSYFDHAHPPIPTSNPISRRPSDEERRGRNGLASGFNSGMQTPEHLDYQDLSLSRVPSYSTAVKAPLRNMTLGDMRDLPNYQTATSRPASPVRSHTTGSVSTAGSSSMAAAAAAQAPAQASAHSRTMSGDAAEPAPNPFLNASRRNHSFQHIRDMGLSALHSIRGSGDEDGDRRLHILRARGKH